MKYPQAQDSLNTQMVTDELLPLLHPDLDMEKNGENDTAKLMENVLCGFLEDGFEELASLYLNHFDEAAVTKVKKRCEQIAGEDVTSTAMLEMAVFAPLLASEKNGKKIYEAMVPAVTEILTQMNRLHQVLSETLDEKERKNLQHTISICVQSIAECMEWVNISLAWRHRQIKSYIWMRWIRPQETASHWLQRR